MNDTKLMQRPIGAATRAVSAVPPVGGPRPGSFWQRWKEWERDHGTVPPVRDRAA